jgi:hypothetical protein
MRRPHLTVCIIPVVSFQENAPTRDLRFCLVPVLHRRKCSEVCEVSPKAVPIRRLDGTCKLT